MTEEGQPEKTPLALHKQLLIIPWKIIPIVYLVSSPIFLTYLSTPLSGPAASLAMTSHTLEYRLLSSLSTWKVRSNMETSGTGAYTTIPCSRPRLLIQQKNVFVDCILKTYIEGRYLIASSSSEGQGAGTRFSEKSHLRFFLCDAGPRVGDLMSFVGPITAFKKV